MNENVESQKKEKLRTFLKTGHSLVTGALSTVPGAITGDPSYIVYGSAANNAITTVLNDVIDRNLSTREQMRMGATALMAVDKLESLISKGAKIRNDGFFNSNGIDRADAEEIFEAVLLKNKNEHEERKLQFTANIFPNVCIDESVTSFEANHFIRLSDSLSYYQLCFLSYLYRKSEFHSLSLSKKDITKQAVVFRPKEISMLQQIHDMYNKGLVVLFDESDDSKREKPVTYEDSTAILGISDIIPDYIRPTELGEKLYTVMNLMDVNRSDITKMCQHLNY